jgi:DNA-binding protein H-NS
MNPLFAGLQSAGQSIAGGIQQRQKNKEVRSRYSQILTGMGHDPDELAGLSIGDLGGMVESGAMQFADQKQQAELQRLQQENEAFRRAMETQQRGQQAENQFMGQLRQFDQGVGRGVLNQETQQRYGLALQDPAIAQAAQTGMPLEIAQRYFPQQQGMSPKDEAQTRKILLEGDQLERGMAAAPGTFASAEEAEAALGSRQGQAVQGTDGRYRIQFQTGASEREHNVEQLIRLQRTAEESGDTESAAVYQDIITKARQGQQYSPTELMMMRAMGINVDALIGKSSPPEAQKAEPEEFDREAALGNVYDLMNRAPVFNKK